MPRLNLVVLRALDPVGLASFYSKLGLNFIQHRHGSGPEHFASENDGCVFEIYPASSKHEPTRELRLGFEVNDVVDAIARLVESGAKLISAPSNSPWGLRAVLQDLEGHKVEITESRQPEITV